MDTAANQLARVLMQRGVGAGQSVAVAIPHGPYRRMALRAIFAASAQPVVVQPQWSAAETTDALAAVAAGLTISRVRHTLPDTMSWLPLDHPAVKSRCLHASGDPITLVERLAG